MEFKTRNLLVKIAAGYDLLLGVGIVIISKFVFSILKIPYPDEPIFLYITGLFILVFGIMLWKIPITNPEFYLIAYSSAFVRISYFFIVLIRYFTSDSLGFGLFLISCTDLITGIMLIVAVYNMDKQILTS